MTYFPDTAGGVPIAILPDGGTLALSDVDVINRAGLDYRAALRSQVTLARQTQVASRSTPLPATLTLSDNDRNVQLTGSAGGALSVDDSVVDGFRCFVINNSTGSVILSGISARPSGLASIASGAHASILVSGAAAYAAVSYGFPAAVDAAALAAVL